MKSIARITVSSLVALTLLTPPLWAAEDTAGFVDFGKFAKPGEGRQFVEVNVGAALISIAARITEKSEPEVAELLKGLKSVRVNVIGLDAANRGEMTDKAAKIRGELESKGWERVVTVQEKQQDVGVYLKHRGEEAIEGVVVTVIDGDKEAVFVNVVGDIRPEKLAVIGERLNIEPLKKAAESIKKS
ncbi:MAG: DUF4252 domain-containing protein [Verrucomicrobiales bacterium]|nr:DUF4252 domain-containing protein [Verrucomicrobiales bacterium]